MVRSPDIADRFGTDLSGLLAGAVALIAGAMLLPACAEGSGDRAGGVPRNDHRALTLAHVGVSVPEPLRLWAAVVAERTDGRLTIEFRDEWRADESDYEANTIADVRNGEVDMAAVGAGVFDTLGVTDFQALLAPMLVDSYELEAAVFEAGIPDEMLAGVDGVGLVGVGVLPGPMRRLLSRVDPFLTPADFESAVIGLQPSGVAEQSFVSLGATTRRVFGRGDMSQLDGYEQHLSIIWANHYERVAEVISANVNIWPRPAVLVIAPDTYESLDDDQRAGLRDAARAVGPAAIEAVVDEDLDAAASLCSKGMTFTEATTDEIDELRTAVGDVHEELGTDRDTARRIAAITRIKDRVGVPPSDVSCVRSPVTGAVPAGSSTSDELPEATFEMTLTPTDGPSDCPLDEEAKYDETLFQLNLDNGAVEMWVEYGGRGGRREWGWIGSYAVFRDRVELTDSEGVMSARWSFDGRRLTFTDLRNYPSCGDVVVWTTHPWTLVDSSTPDGS
jgi:TRAP-type transport system periplasmic protein